MRVRAREVPVPRPRDDLQRRARRRARAATALALPLFLLFSRVQLTDTFWAVFLPSVVSPFGVYLARVRRGIRARRTLEASRLDGAGEVRTFFTVSIRLMFPALITVFLFQFVTIWNNFFLPLMLRSEELFPVTYGLYAWNSINQFPELAPTCSSARCSRSSR